MRLEIAIADNFFFKSIQFKRKEKENGEHINCVYYRDSTSAIDSQLLPPSQYSFVINYNHCIELCHLSKCQYII